MNHLSAALRVLCLCIFSGVAVSTPSSEPLSLQSQELVIPEGKVQVKVPAGYRLERLPARLKQPRMLHFGPDGEALVGSRSGHVYRLYPPYEQTEILIQLEDYPHSVVLRDGQLLIAQTGGLYAAPYPARGKNIAPDSVQLLAALPQGGGHTSRTLGLGPQGRVYLSLGISGNCDDEYLDDSYPFGRRRGGVLVLEESGEKPRWRTYASGLRNPVGFDWHPTTGVLYASNNGPDHLGYEQPAEVFARLEAGSFHGMPWFWFDGVRIQRDDCISRTPPRPKKEVSLPVATFPARNAPMGVAFVPAGAMDPQLEGDAVVALRGSWGTQPKGHAGGDPASRRPPALMRVRFEQGEAAGVEPLLTGFQNDRGERWARPVGVAMGPDGQLYFTSDSASQGLYRLRRVVNEAP